MLSFMPAVFSKQFQLCGRLKRCGCGGCGTQSKSSPCPMKVEGAYVKVLQPAAHTAASRAQEACGAMPCPSDVPRKVTPVEKRFSGIY